MLSLLGKRIRCDSCAAGYARTSDCASCRHNRSTAGHPHAARCETAAAQGCETGRTNGCTGERSACYAEACSASCGTDSRSEGQGRTSRGHGAQHDSGSGAGILGYDVSNRADAIGHQVSPKNSST